MGTGLELHHSHAFESADLGFPEERVVQQRTDLIVYSGLNGFRESPLRLAKPWNLLNGSLCSPGQTIRPH